MNDDQARQTAWKILGEVEEMMSGPGVGILPEGRSGGRREKAFFLDDEYNELEDSIADLLRGAASQAQTPLPASRPRGDEDG